MLSSLKKHPFAVEAFFTTSAVAAFSVVPDQILHLIPDCLELDLFNDKWAFVAAAMVDTKSLRPKGWPEIFGSDFFLIGYRVFVRFRNSEGRSMRGLYILSSATNKNRMALLGGLFTHYNYSLTDIETTRSGDVCKISSNDSDLLFTYEHRNGEEVSLPSGSPFIDWSEARKFAGPLPYTFSYDAADESVLIIEGVRQNWRPAPIRVLEYRFPYLESLGLQDAQLANAFLVQNVPYSWKRGRSEKWKPA